MGAACCVASKDKTIVHGPSGGPLQRHVRYSPSWNFRWDNRVSGEETHANWLRDGDVRNDHVEIKTGAAVRTAFASEESSPRDTIRLHWQNSSPSDGNVGIINLQDSDESISRNVEVKESAESPLVSHTSPVKQSPLAASMSTSPLTMQNQVHRANLSPSRFHRYSRGPQFLHQATASQIPECKSPPFSNSEDAFSHLPPDWGSESIRGSNGGSSDWSIPVFSGLTPTRRRRDRWSFDSENSGYSVDKIGRSSWRSSDSPSIDNLHTCGVCAKLLSERSLWGWSRQKIVSTNELAVVSILNCGHVYHAECLENMTPEINKYDPACPVCTYGEKQALKMSEKALKDGLDSKARKRSRKQVVNDSDRKSNLYFDFHEHGGADGKGSSKISSSSIIKRSSSLGKPFWKRHFSFGSNSDKRSSENQFAPGKGFFWARSSKE